MASSWITIVVLGILAVALLISYVLIPIVVFRSYRVPIPVEVIEVDDDEEFPEEIRAHFANANDSFEQEGFDRVGTVYLPSAPTDVRSIFALYANRATSESAMVSFVIAVNVPWRISEMFVAIASEFSDGVEIGTDNSSRLDPFPSKSKCYRTQFPEIDDIHRLVRIHRFLVERYRESGRPEESSLDFESDGGLAESFSGDMERSYAAKVEAGYYVRTPREFRFTVTGAFIATWRQFWPLKSLLLWRQQRHSARLLLEYEATTDRRIG